MRSRVVLLFVLGGAAAIGACAVGASENGGDDAGSQSDGSSGNDAKPNGDAGGGGDAKSDGACTAPLTVCAGDGGGCVDTTTDLEHCGNCTTACTSADAGGLVLGSNNNPDAGIPHDGGVDAGEPWSLGTPTCAKSACGTTCPTPLTVCSDGVCYDTQQFHDHCGDCNTACMANEYCTTGHCCATGTAYCTSACIDVLGDKNNCGACGNKCGANTQCVGGTCSSCGAINEALTATATGSGGGASPYAPPTANNGVLETGNCNSFAWITAGNTPGTAWIQYTWSSAHTLTNMHMDTTSATVADTCGYVGRTLGAATVQWWNGSTWITDGTVSGQMNDWDYTFTSPVTTTQVRLYAIYCTNTSNQTSNPIIFEWQVFGCN